MGYSALIVFLCCIFSEEKREQNHSRFEYLEARFYGGPYIFRSKDITKIQPIGLNS